MSSKFEPPLLKQKLHAFLAELFDLVLDNPDRLGPRGNHRVQTAQIMDALDFLMTTLTRLRNTLPPVSQLPTEILCEIFRWTPLETPVKDMQTRPTFEHLPHFLPLRLVCKEWDAIVTRNQPLWSCIQSVKASTKWIDLCLARSGSLPLTVKKYLTRDKMDHEPFLESITPHMARTMELEIVLPEFTSKRRADYLISTLLEACSPSLRILRINDTAYVEPSLIKVEIGSHITGLRELKMQKLPFPNVAITSFRSLRGLILHSPQGSLDNLIPLLSSCPCLSHLELFHDPRAQDGFSGMPDCVDMPSLTYFRGTSLPVLAVGSILKQLRMPLLRTLILTYKGYEGLPDVHKAGGVLKALALLRPGPITSIELAPETKMIIKAPQMVIVLDEGSYQWNEFFRWMVKHSVPQLRVTLHSADMEGYGIPSQLRTAGLPIAELRLPNKAKAKVSNSEPPPAKLASDGTYIHPPSSKRRRTVEGLDRSNCGTLKKLKSSCPGMRIVEEGPSDRDVWVNDASKLTYTWLGMEWILMVLWELGYGLATEGQEL